MLEGNQKCPKCGKEPEYVGGNTAGFIFFCPHCQEKFSVADTGFGYLPMRAMIMRELYPTAQK